jgi:hypothetical protein
MKKELRPRAREADLVVQEAGDEILVYDLLSNRAKCLNEPSAHIWRQCDGNRSAREIAREMTRNMKSDVSEEYVTFGLAELSKHKLIASGFEPSEKVSRRDVIKRIGLTSVIALPIISSMVAPLAVHANSACVTGGTCTCSSQTGQGTICPSVAGCADMNCQCQQINNGNSMGTCVA